MGKITSNELSESLNDLIDEKLNTEEYSLMTENKTIVGAINEIYGKEIIANAIGDPLDRSDTFTEMSNDINNLLSTFKTNMINNGVTVKSGDKFKQLIDKIATLPKGLQYASGTKTDFNVNDEHYDGVTTVIDMDIDFTPNIVFFTCESISSDYIGTIDYIAVNSSVSNSSATETVFRGFTGNSVFMHITNISSTSFDLCSRGSISFKGVVWHAIGAGEIPKGIQYAEGTYEDFTLWLTTSGSSVEVPCELNFTPTLIFVKFDSINNTSGTTITNAVISSKSAARFYMNYGLALGIDNISSNSFSMTFSYGDNSNITFRGVTWYAIGVGEEDTTLSGGLDIISAIELPATGKENQICVITSNPTDNYVVTHDYDYSDTTNIILYNGSKNSAPLINIVSGSVTQQYYITKIIQNDKYKLLESYYWSNNQWNSLTKSYVIIVQDGKVQNTNIIGDIKSQSYVMIYDNVSGSLLTPYSSTYSDSYVGTTTTKKIDFGKYTTVTITAKVSNGNRYIYVGPSPDSTTMAGESTVYLDNFFTKYVSKNLTSTSYVDLTFDISGYTGEYYLGFGFSKASAGSASSVYIKDIKLS